MPFVVFVVHRKEFCRNPPRGPLGKASLRSRERAAHTFFQNNRQIFCAATQLASD